MSRVTPKILSLAARPAAAAFENGAKRVTSRLRVVATVLLLVAASAVAAVAAAPSAEAVTRGGACNGFKGAVLLGAAYHDSTLTVPACGPQPMLGGSQAGVTPYPGSARLAGYQCVEFSERYLYFKFGLTMPMPTDGVQIVDHYKFLNPSKFAVYKNGARGHAPIQGDVLSFSINASFRPEPKKKDGHGHTAVVQSSHVNSSGNGIITIIEENGGSSNGANKGKQTLKVEGWIVPTIWNTHSYQHAYVKWLHPIAQTPPPKPPTLPAEPTSPRVASTTNSSATVTWTDASHNENNFASQYRVGNGAWTPGPSVGANTTALTIRGLKASTMYTFQIGAHNGAGTHWSAYAYGTTKANPSPPSTQPALPTYHAGFNATIDRHASGGVSGHTGPSNGYRAGPTRPKGAAVWIVCYVPGQSITGPYGTTTIWDLSDDGYYYTDAWIYTGSNDAVVPRCARRIATVDRHATRGVSGHTGPSNSYAASPTRPSGTTVTLMCYVSGQSITGPYGTTTMWDLATDGYYYTDAWIYTGSNTAVIPRC